MRKDILFCGVGGQGIVLASKLAAASCLRKGETVHSAETIGMAQRGGSVTSHVRIGEEVYSPIIPLGSADIIIAFEPAEAVRNLKYLKKGGLVIVNTVPVKPIGESLKKDCYNGSEMIEYLTSENIEVVLTNAGEVCGEFGSLKCFNVLALGIAIGTGKSGIRREDVFAEIDEKIPEKYRELNKKAFLKGEQIGEKYEFNRKTDMSD